MSSITASPCGLQRSASNEARQAVSTVLYSVPFPSTLVGEEHDNDRCNSTVRDSCVAGDHLSSCQLQVLSVAVMLSSINRLVPASHAGMDGSIAVLLEPSRRGSKGTFKAIKSWYAGGEQTSKSSSSKNPKCEE